MSEKENMPKKSASERMSEKVMSELKPKDPKMQEMAKNGSLDLVSTVVGVAAFLLAIYPAHYVWTNKKSGAVDIPKVSVVDVDLIEASFVNNIMGDNQEDPIAQTKRLEEKSAQMVAVIDEMKANGHIVLDKRLVLSFPEGNDVTDKVAEKMGIRLLDGSRFKTKAVTSPARVSSQEVGSAGDGSLD